MVRHIILWKLKSDLPESEIKEIKLRAKRELEALQGKIAGLIKIRVHTDNLSSSNADMMLETELESEKALSEYQKHPAHRKAADEFIRPFTEIRMCMDFEA